MAHGSVWNDPCNYTTIPRLCSCMHHHTLELQVSLNKTLPFIFIYFFSFSFISSVACSAILISSWLICQEGPGLARTRGRLMKCSLRLGRWKTRRGAMQLTEVSIAVIYLRAMAHIASRVKSPYSRAALPVEGKEAGMTTHWRLCPPAVPEVGAVS